MLLKLFGHRIPITTKKSIHLTYTGNIIKAMLTINGLILDVINYPEHGELKFFNNAEIPNGIIEMNMIVECITDDINPPVITETISPVQVDKTPNDIYWIPVITTDPNLINNVLLFTDGLCALRYIH